MEVKEETVRTNELTNERTKERKKERNRDLERNQGSIRYIKRK